MAVNIQLPDRDTLSSLQVLWDYMHLNMPLKQADCIVGFGNYNVGIARRAAELYLAGYAPRVLFTGGLGRNTLGLLPEPEAVRFARVAMEAGVPEEAILIEDRSANTGENILFTKALLQNRGLPAGSILGVHQPFMERRIFAALGVYWPEVEPIITSPQMTIPQYLTDSQNQGISLQAAIAVIVGDFQRMELYARKGYQLPQVIPPEAWDAFHRLVELGYGTQLAKE